MKYYNKQNKYKTSIVIYTLHPIHYNSDNEIYYIVTDSNNTILSRIQLNNFRFVSGFNKKSYLRGSKEHGFSTWKYLNVEEIDEYIYNHVTPINSLNNGIKTNNNYSQLKHCGTIYAEGTNLYQSGLFRKLKTLFTITKEVIKT